METSRLKTSADWVIIHDDITVLDPDGWDRQNFDYSWNIELITEEEFLKRRMFSTCMMFGRGDA